MSGSLTRLSLLALVALGIATAAMAQSDRDAPIEIEADHAEYTESSGVSTYTGNVVLTQAGLKLRGNKLTISRDEGSGSIQAVLIGAPARLHKAADAQTKQPVTGHAQRMQYDSEAQQVVLNGEAVVERGGDAIRGETIRHDLTEGTTEAERADDNGSERVRITIQPETADSADNQDGR